MEQQLVVFSLADEYYGLNIDSVESIVKMQSIAVVPNSLPFIEGIISLRGIIMPVINLRKRFGLPGRESDINTRIIVAIKDDLKVGIIIDSVSEVIRILDEDIEPSPSIVATGHSTFVKGIAKAEERLIILLNLIEILNLENLPSLKTNQPMAIAG